MQELQEQEKEAGEACWGLRQLQGRKTSEQEGNEIIEKGMERETNRINLRFGVDVRVDQILS